MIRDIVLYPDQCLEMTCKPVEEFDTGDLHRLVADMFEAMYFHGGIGLAAPQVGITRQVAVIDPSSGRDSREKIVLVNPVVTEVQGTQFGEEGCLSFPGFIEQVTRPMNVTVDARNETGAEVHLESTGLLSRALQHEIDHLNGILFIRRMSSLKSRLIRNKIRRMLAAGTWKSTPMTRQM